jgi:hypothetical protein
MQGMSKREWKSTSNSNFEILEIIEPVFKNPQKTKKKTIQNYTEVFKQTLSL